ncbi:MAG: PKD domain-containing protein [Flavobacteriales bacterium]|nr:PKD domain-containing protein [Flavobacteriales bacterium]
MIEGFPSWGFETEYTFSEGGSHDIQLTTTTDQGCVFTTIIPINVNYSAEVEIDYDGVCAGDLTSFDLTVDDLQAGGAISYLWDFGDLTNSFDAEPVHFFTEPGNYDLVVEVVTANGCTTVVEDDFTLFDLPEITFEFGLTCTGIPVEWSADVEANGGDVISWQWTLDGESLSSEPNGELLFDVSSDHLWSLTAATTNECVSSSDTLIMITDSPTPIIEYGPTFGSAPLEVLFAGESDANTFAWQFGDGNESEGAFTSHIYQEDGVYSGSLTATDELGCYGSSDFSIQVADPQIDLVLELLTMEEGIVSCVVINESNVTVSDLKMSWKLSDDAPISEIWDITLTSGESAGYSFTAIPNPQQSAIPFLCADVQMLDEYTDINPDNNKQCVALALENSIVVSPPFPNPAHDQMELTILVKQSQEIEIEVVSVDGRTAFWSDQVQLNSGYNSLQLDVGFLRSGYYLLHIHSENFSETHSFLRWNSP